MKKLFVVFLISISFNLYSQILYEKGYFINNTDKKVECLIRNNDWKYSPKKFKYKLSENSKTETAGINDVKEFGIYNISKYIRADVDIDTSTRNINLLSDIKAPLFDKQRLFLKVLVEGRANLYLYETNDLLRFFYKTGNSGIKQLIYKKYKASEYKMGTNFTFRQQIWNKFRCQSIKPDRITKLKYKKSDLTKYFIDYNKCKNSKYTNFTNKQKRKSFNLTLRYGIHYSSLSLWSSIENYSEIDFDPKITYSVGLETEFILPFNKNKWALAIEPNFIYFKADKTLDVIHVSGGKLIADVDFKSIEFPFGIKYSIFLKNKSKIFINVSYVLDYRFDSFVTFTRKDASGLLTLECSTRNSFAFGIGYKINRISAELRYNYNKEILEKYLYWSSNLSSLSLKMGYSLFK